ncbi:MAG: glycosyltransferase family 39 protein [Candidatus Saccharimonas sp.]|jgi:hypothetical protein
MKATAINHTAALAAQSKYSTTPLRALNPRTLTVDIVLPVLNEAYILEESVRTLCMYMEDNLPYHYQIIIADNGSTDGTRRVAAMLAEHFPAVRAVCLPEKGRGRALKQVWLQSRADIVSYMDIDLSTNLGAFVPMITPLVTGDAAIAVGSRLMEKSQTTRGLKRDIISRCYNRLIRWTMHTKFVDAQCGFKAMRRDVAQQLLPHVKDTAWFFDTELLIKAEYEGYMIHEEPVEWIEDTDSRVHIVKTAAEDIKGLSRVRGEYGRVALFEAAGFGGLLLMTSMLYLRNITINGMANSYYATAAQAASVNWTAWLFGSLDAANFMSVDKPPVSTMIMGLFGRVFGFSSWSMLVPHALAGVTTVALVYAAVRRWYGVKSALIAGAVMALTPVAVLMFRFNNPDSFLTLFLTASAYAFLRTFDSKKPVLWLSAAGLLAGFAFNTKMLQGLLVLPVMAVLYIACAKPAVMTRVRYLGVAGIATVASTFWWSVLVWLTPAAYRPWVGSTNNNDIWSLIFGYNGFGRLFGGRGGVPGSAGGGPGGVGFGGETGVLRIFNESFGPNIAWLIPAALIGGGLVIWLLRRAPRDNKERAGVLLWLGWLFIHIVVFSMTSGTIHPYYVVAMAPAVAALVGIGVLYIWKAYTRRTHVWWIVPLTIATTTITSVIMLGYRNDWTILMWIVGVAGVAATGIAVILPPRISMRLRRMMLACAVISAGAAPIAYSISTVMAAHSGSIPTAEPNASAMNNTNNEAASAEAALVKFLLANQQGAMWIAAVDSANTSAPIQLSTKQPVMAIGGFNGSDSALTLQSFKQLVATGKVRYYVVDSRSRGGGPGGNSDIAQWAASLGVKIEYGGTQYAVYDLKNAAL